MTWSSKRGSLICSPRIKRWGSSMARSAEKLFEWPLCGVAERKRRCSKSGVSSRMPRVNWESIAQADDVAGAAWCASSRTSMEPERMLVEPIAKGRGVLFIAQEGVGDDELRMSGPWVDRVTAFAAAIEEVVPVENDETQAEAGFHFALPLGDERGGACDDDAFHLLAHDHFAEDEAGFDRFAESDVVGDEEVDARHLERLLQRLQLVGHDLDAGAVWRLEKSWVSGGYEVPAKCVEVSGKDVRRVEPLRARCPQSVAEHLGIDLAFPEDGEVLALGVILQAGKIDERLFPSGIASGLDSFDEMSATANLYDLAG